MVSYVVRFPIAPVPPNLTIPETGSIRILQDIMTKILNNRLEGAHHHLMALESKTQERISEEEDQGHFFARAPHQASWQRAVHRYHLIMNRSHLLVLPTCQLLIVKYLLTDMIMIVRLWWKIGKTINAVMFVGRDFGLVSGGDTTVRDAYLHFATNMATQLIRIFSAAKFQAIACVTSVWTLQWTRRRRIKRVCWHICDYFVVFESRPFESSEI